MLQKKKKRLFRKPIPWQPGIAVLAFGLVALAACAPRTMHWSPAEAPKKNRVSWAEFHHPVRFTDASTTVSTAERDALLRFLHRVGRGQGARITLAAGSSESARLRLQRETALADVLRKSGYTASLGESPKGDASPDNVVRVTVGRHVVKAPACPDWSKPATGDPSNNAGSNFGCATETNLGLMVADPGVLLHGVDDVGPADGEAVTIGIENYRNDKIDEADPVSSKSGGGS